MWNLFKRNKLENENINKKDYNAVIIKNTSEVSVKEAQDTSKSKLLIERDTIVEAENKIKESSEQGNYKAAFTFRNKLDDPKMILFFKYFTDKGFSVYPNVLDPSSMALFVDVSWKPNDIAPHPTFINMGIANNIKFIVYNYLDKDHMDGYISNIDFANEGLCFKYYHRIKHGFENFNYPEDSQHFGNNLKDVVNQINILIRALSREGVTKWKIMTEEWLDF